MLGIRIKSHMLMTVSKVIACGGVNHFHSTYKNCKCDDDIARMKQGERTLVQNVTDGR